MIRQINQMISSALSLKQLEETCNLRTETLAAQNQWQRFGGTGTLKDACVTNNTQMYNDERYGCCPGDRFWAPGSRQPAQVVYDYLIYKKELQRNIDSMKVKANDADFHIGNIKVLLHACGSCNTCTLRHAPRVWAHSVHACEPGNIECSGQDCFKEMFVCRNCLCCLRGISLL
jgi:hypothetical protein